jgi:hypothetical protein
MFDFACGDEVYGSCTQLREHLEEHGQAYMLRVASNFTVTLAPGTKVTCAEAVKRLVKPTSTAGHLRVPEPKQRNIRGRLTRPQIPPNRHGELLLCASGPERHRTRGPAGRVADRRAGRVEAVPAPCQQGQAVSRPGDRPEGAEEASASCRGRTRTAHVPSPAAGRPRSCRG